MLPCDAPAGIPALRRSGCPGPPGEAPTRTRPAGRAQTPAPSRTPRHWGSELGYACKRSIGCTTKNAGAPEREVTRGPTRDERVEGSGAESGVDWATGDAPLYPRPTRQPRAHPPAANLRRARRGNERDAPHHGLRQTRRPSLDCHRGIGHRAGVPPAGAARKLLGSCPALRLPPEGRLVRSTCPPHTLPYTGSNVAVPCKPRQLEGGRKLYRSHSQLSITQRVRRPPPNAGPAGVEGAMDRCRPAPPSHSAARAASSWAGSSPSTMA